MPRRVLVAHASRLGSTAAVAGAVSSVLRDCGWQVEVREMRRAGSLDDFDTAVLGTAIRIGKPLPEAMKFVRARQEWLRGRRFALFSLGTTMRSDTPENRQQAREYLNPLLEIIGDPVSIGLFGGTIDHARLPRIWRFLAKHDQSGAMREGDWRDWSAIHAWAESLPELFAAAADGKT